MGFFSFLRRKDPESYAELDAVSWEAVRSKRPALVSLGADDAAALRRLASWFLDAKTFVPIGGAAPGGVDKATVAALACLPILRLGASWYDDWSTILLTPSGFKHSMTSVDEAGVVTEYEDELSGRVTELGPVLLSLSDVRESGYGDSYNVVVHEMAHKLDERDGALDGCPPLPRSIRRREWKDAFSSAYDDFKGRVENRARRGRWNRSTRLPLDEYAAESRDEFFAVACEAYFDAPDRLQLAYPEVFGLMGRFFSGEP
ncbi:MAG: zinc-dependent peptidase [Spirochaetes bacterium]|nr:zinc-dependent peptidase [Spirochaetota bacterium]MBU1082105.1 zinc-dependent peptidase [Spirochaetota bacterium]